MPPESKKTFDHLTELHEKYSRHDLRGMWQRDPSSASPMDLDDQKFSDPNSPLQVIKDTLAEIGK